MYKYYYYILYSDNMTVIYLFYIIKYVIFTDNKIMRLFVLLIITL